jgi:hypothetical protein
MPPGGERLMEIVVNGSAASPTKRRRQADL